MRFSPLLFPVLLAASAAAAPGADPPAAARQNDDLAALVREFKADPRGPFQAIRWFCPDGSVLPPQERCAEPGGLQHALVKESVSALARDRGIHLGQILAGTPPTLAVKYQILIMFTITAGTGFGTLAAVMAASRRLFDERERLRIDRLGR